MVTVTSCRYYIMVAKKLGIIFVRFNFIKDQLIFIDRAIGHLSRQLECVVQQQGGHIEH